LKERKIERKSKYTNERKKERKKKEGTRKRNRVIEKLRKKQTGILSNKLIYETKN